MLKSNPEVLKAIKDVTELPNDLNKTVLKSGKALDKTLAADKHNNASKDKMVDRNTPQNSIVAQAVTIVHEGPSRPTFTGEGAHADVYEFLQTVEEAIGKGNIQSDTDKINALLDQLSPQPSEARRVLKSAA